MAHAPVFFEGKEKIGDEAGIAPIGLPESSGAFDKVKRI